MRYFKNDRGFRFILHEVYPPNGTESRLISESSVIGDYDDSFECPGSSCLWVGENHHLDREEVAELVSMMQYWLDNKRLPLSANDLIANEEG